MNDVLNNFKIIVAESEIGYVEKWWNDLTNENRQQIVALFEEKNDEFVEVKSESRKRKSKSKKSFVIYGQFESSQEFDSNPEWHKDFYEYLVSNPEALILIGQFHTPKYHVCTQHEKARDVLRKGLIPHDFDCPFKDDNCLMRKILKEKPGESLKLTAFQTGQYHLR